MTERIQLAFDPQAPQVARLFVGRCLRDWGYDTLVPDAELLTSELVTNSVKHGAEPVVVELDDLIDGVVVLVEDFATELPVWRKPDPTSEGGRGLHILGALASAWGVGEVPHDGKFVWFRLASPAPLVD